MDCSLPGSSVYEIFQARILEWVTISFLQGLFLTQRSNPCLLHWLADSLPLSCQGSPNLHTAVCQLYLNKTGRRKKGIQISRLKLGRVREYNGEGNGTPLQYSCLENPMDRGAWQATVHGVTRVGHNLVTKPSACLEKCILKKKN